MSQQGQGGFLGTEGVWSDDKHGPKFLLAQESEAQPWLEAKLPESRTAQGT